MNRLVLLAWLVPTVAEAPHAAHEPRLARDDDFGVEQTVPKWVLHRSPQARPALLPRKASCGVSCRFTWHGGGEWSEGLRAEEIRRVIRDHRHSIRYCYETALINDPTLAGRVVVRFIIGESGAVTESAVTESIGNTELDDCVAGRIGLMPFPSPGATAMAVVNYPFVFEPAP